MSHVNNVTKMYPPTFADNPDNILEDAKGQLKEVLLLGYGHDGKLYVTCDNHIARNQDRIIALLERVKINALYSDWSEVLDD